MRFAVKSSVVFLLLAKYCYAAEAELATEQLQARAISSERLYSFDARSLFGRQNQDVDLDYVKQTNGVAVGEYSLNTSINNERALGQLNLKFDHLDASSTAVLCIDEQLLQRLDLRQEILEKLQKKDCLLIKDLSPDAYYDLNMADLTLNFSLPLTIINQRPRGYIAPESFDKGVTSAFVGYDFNRYSSKSEGRDETTNNYLSLRGGLNLGRFNYRHAGSFQSNGEDLTSYRSYLNTISTDVLPLNARVTGGDFSTQTYGVESASIRGLQLASDLSMLPSSQRSYAPLIRGVANTNALVSVFQNGNKIYERTVPAGDFEFNDLTAGNSGDLTVQITENGGEKRSFIVPMQGNMNLIRVGQLNYSVASGRYQLGDKLTDTYVGQLSGEYGLSNYLSLYSGANITKEFQNYLLGLGHSNRLGGFRFDLEHSRASLAERDQMGQKYKLGYQFTHSPANLSLYASAQYQDRKFLSLANTMSLKNYEDLDQDQLDNFFLSYNLKQQLNFSVTKGFEKAELGNVSFSVLKSDFWNSAQDYTQYSLNYNNSWHKLNYSLGYSQSDRRSFASNNNKEQQFSLSLTMPLSWGKRPASLYSNVQHSNTAGRPTSASVGMSGTAGENNQIGYGLSTSHNWSDNTDRNSSISANVNYKLPSVSLGAVVGTSDQQTQYGFSARGALVAHPHGVTATNEISDTYAIIHAKGAKGASVMNAWGSKVDYFGNAIYSNLSPYMNNTISINTKDLDMDLSLKSNQSQVIPRRYSSPLIEFAVEKTSNILLVVKVPEGNKQVPIGVQAKTQDGQSIGVFGQSNQLFVENADLLNQDLLVQWGAEQQQSCLIAAPEKLLPKQKQTKTMQLVDVECK
ncbi:fimbria/pilus outer membrane usher protein [Acinetobacter calcoaceticus]|uniref:fimbria/pilus outer membrane usher protein n=1 Tax=Acinetobacter calcoaceticus TaxID=471 RepID=UPI00192AA282|nr:fimbria/pilus outer membrane usher protein [Acinetobacter calcoaceticus]